jgi:hypothetical protein
VRHDGKGAYGNRLPRPLVPVPALLTGQAVPIPLFIKLVGVITLGAV